MSARSDRPAKADWLDDRGDAIRLRIRALPRASRTMVVGPHGDALKIRIAAPPVDGAANDELVRFISKALRVPRASVRVISGDTGRNKVVEVKGATTSGIVSAFSEMAG